MGPRIILGAILGVLISGCTDPAIDGPPQSQAQLTQLKTAPSEISPTETGPSGRAPEPGQLIGMDVCQVVGFKDFAGEGRVYAVGEARPDPALQGQLTLPAAATRSADGARYQIETPAGLVEVRAIEVERRGDCGDKVLCQQSVRRVENDLGMARASNPDCSP